MIEAETVLLVPTDAVFPGTEASEQTMQAAVADLSRDDAFFFCAHINAVISGFGSQFSNYQRQDAVISLLCSKRESWAFSDYALRHGGPERVMAFFRGQVLELARCLALNGRNLLNDGYSFTDPTLRSTFLKAALIAATLWQRKLFPDDVRPSLDREKQIRALMGAYRKSMEDGNQAGNPGLIMSRGWTLFSRYLPKYLPGFESLFERATKLTLRQYFICATALMNLTFADHQRELRAFDTDYVTGTTAYKEVFRRFMALLSQTPEQWANALTTKPNDSGYLSLRERPILNFGRRQSVIFDPNFYLDNLTSAPLFYIRSTGISMQKVFGAFGDAFEKYAVELLRARFPLGNGLLYQPLSSNVPGKTGDGQDFEVDAVLNDVTAAVFMEMKAVFVREETVLTGNPDAFVDELRLKYGHLEGSGERDKGVAQLSRSVGALVRGEWMGPNDEYANVRQVYPVLVVFDVRMAAPGCCHFLDSEFRGLLGNVPAGLHVHSVIVLTIDDLEHLVSGVEALSFVDFIRAYSSEDPDRMGSVHNFIAGSRYYNQVRSSPVLETAFDELIQAVREELGVESAPSSAANT